MLGIVANPASGKDVRRLVARASVFDNQEKQAIVGRALIGAAAAGADRIAYYDDPHGIVRAALDEHGTALQAEAVDATQTSTPLDTISAARAMADCGCTCVLTLGGDGTNRAFATGWRTATLLPLSTGTNNVFPVLTEATIAGAAAGLIASGRVTAADTGTRQKIIDVDIHGESSEIALIDAVLSRERFVGARALLSPDHLAAALLTRADPAAVGITSIGGLLAPHSADQPGGLLLAMEPPPEPSEPISVFAPIAPGYYRNVCVYAHRRVSTGETVEVTGPGVLAFDGERERVLQSGQRATLRISTDGPTIVDVRRTLAAAVAAGCFTNIQTC